MALYLIADNVGVRKNSEHANMSHFISSKNFKSSCMFCNDVISSYLFFIEYKSKSGKKNEALNYLVGMFD